MADEQLGEVRDLLSAERLLALSVPVDESPWVGLLPFVVTPRFDAAIVHASRLARHHRGLAAEAEFAGLVHRPDRPGADPMQIPRLTLRGNVRRLERDGPEYTEARSLYLARFPTSAPTFGLADFDLFRLGFEKGRWVGGFARAVGLGPREIARLDPTAGPRA